eukprot:668461-Prymnesium_polylepis.1
MTELIGCVRGCIRVVGHATHGVRVRSTLVDRRARARPVVASHRAEPPLPLAGGIAKEPRSPALDPRVAPRHLILHFGWDVDHRVERALGRGVHHRAGRRVADDEGVDCRRVEVLSERALPEQSQHGEVNASTPQQSKLVPKASDADVPMLLRAVQVPRDRLLARGMLIPLFAAPAHVVTHRCQGADGHHVGQRLVVAAQRDEDEAGSRRRSLVRGRVLVAARHGKQRLEGEGPLREDHIRAREKEQRVRPSLRSSKALFDQAEAAADFASLLGNLCAQAARGGSSRLEDGARRDEA